jgi:hypothetical protein
MEYVTMAKSPAGQVRGILSEVVRRANGKVSGVWFAKIESF